MDRCRQVCEHCCRQEWEECDGEPQISSLVSAWHAA